MGLKNGAKIYHTKRTSDANSYVDNDNNNNIVSFMQILTLTLLILCIFLATKDRFLWTASQLVEFCMCSKSKLFDR